MLRLATLQVTLTSLFAVGIMSRVGFLHTGQPWSTHGHSYLCSSLQDSFGWLSWLANNPSGLLFLGQLVQFLLNPCCQQGFPAYAVTCKFCFYLFCVQLCKKIFVTCQAILCLNFKYRDLTLLSSDSVIFMLLL